MSLLLAGLVFATTSGALMVGRWISRRNAPKEPKADEKRATTPKDAGGDGGEEGSAGAGDTNGRRSPPDPKDKRSLSADTSSRVEGFVCQLGDVVMRLTGEEAWLAGGVVLSEQIPISVLFVAPEAGRDTMLYVRSRPSTSLVWLEPLDPNAILVGGEPPSSVEHDGVRFDRSRRLPLRPRRVGVGAPDLGDAVIVAEYTSAGSDRLLVLKANSGVTRAFRGQELEEGMYEVIPSGETTL